MPPLLDPPVHRRQRQRRKRWADSIRVLRARERYAALTDVVDEGLHQWKVADNRVRVALGLLAALNGVLFVVVRNLDVLATTPGRAWLTAVALGAYLALSLLLFLMAVRILRPEWEAWARRVPSDGQEAPASLRSYGDVAARDPRDYVAAWQQVDTRQLVVELADEARAIAAATGRKYADLRRLYADLYALGALTLVLATAAAAVFLRSGPERIRLGHGLKVSVGHTGEGTAEGSGGWQRDWSRFPPVVQRTTNEEIVALGDVHGGYDRLVDLLRADGLIAPVSGSSGPYAWSGHNRLLVCTGDLINKGDQSLRVLDLMRKLEAAAPGSGGQVIVTMGNHEAEFLASPGETKVREFDDELQRSGIDPHDTARGRDEYGQWIMERPLAARVNSWFFAHAGSTSGHTLDELAGTFRGLVDAGQWSSPFLVGDDSILEARSWWNSRKVVDRDLAALRAAHIVFGHDPSAFHAKGQIGERDGGKLFLIDVGMSPAIDYSLGALLIIDHVGRTDVASVFDAAHGKREIWRGPA